ncbi:MAG: preQ(1) synthase [Verrucomicrobiota bacterium]|nr:preQ(1) synthase [Verrucomicrobiota bacterium]
MPARPSSSRRRFKLLGQSAPVFPNAPSVSTLETFSNRFPARDYRVRFETEDFTSLCPITGQPDFARITIDYVPDALCLETKSLKFYLASFRGTRSFNEEVVNRILEDLIAACQPREIFVHGEFAPRGGIRLTVEAFHPATARRPAAPDAQGSNHRG